MLLRLATQGPCWRTTYSTEIWRACDPDKYGPDYVYIILLWYKRVIVHMTTDLLAKLTLVLLHTASCQ